jgi:hypothetical protein
MKYGAWTESATPCSADAALMAAHVLSVATTDCTQASSSAPSFNSLMRAIAPELPPGLVGVLLGAPTVPKINSSGIMPLAADKLGGPPSVAVQTMPVFYHELPWQANTWPQRFAVPLAIKYNHARNWGEPNAHANHTTADDDPDIRDGPRGVEPGRIYRAG